MAGGGGIALSCQKSFKDCLKFFEQHGGYTQQLLKLGYPSLDNLVRDYEQFALSAESQQLRQDSIIVLSLPIAPFMQALVRAINALLKAGYRVVYKAHNGHPELAVKEREFVKQWILQPNFVFYKSPNLSQKELYRSLCMVEFRSSMLYTYPLITGKPALLLQPNKRWFKKNPNIKDNFFESHLQIKIFNTKALLRVVRKMQNDGKFRAQKVAEIARYRRKCAFNFGCASSQIAQFALKVLHNKARLQDSAL